MSDETSTTEKNLTTALDGYFISPDRAKELEYSLLTHPDNEDARWKLLGFYFAHQSCCLKTSNSRGSQILWIVENDRVELSAKCHTYLRIFSKNEEPFVPQIRNAWERRIAAQPDDYDVVFGYGSFLRALTPKEACPYLERALELKPDCSMTRMALRMTQKLSQNSEQEALNKQISEGQVLNEPKPATCFFEVISAVDELLGTTRTKLNPNDETWVKFSVMVNEMARNPSLLAMTQFPKRSFQADDPPVVILKGALKLLLEISMANTEDGITMRQPEFQQLWNELVN